MSNINNLIVSDYLESLKEDGELDQIFPLLLQSMGFRVLAKPKFSKGQPQYGKDIVAIREEGGRMVRYYFELKGGSDRNITDETLFKRDGIKESLLAAKYTPYIDASILNFSNFSIKYVLVHNGSVNENTKPTLNGLITTEFPEGNFERWGIEKLTEYFSDNLFNEYLMTDYESLQLLKKTLVLLDVPVNDFSDFKKLVKIILSNAPTKNNRQRDKFFATLVLLISVVLHYSKEIRNLEPVKECSTYLLLSTWSWILKNKIESKPSIIKSFKKVFDAHLGVLDEYFQKTLPIATIEHGLFSEVGATFETIGYPLRAMEYLNYLTYYFHISLSGKNFLSKEEQKKLLIEIIKLNDGCTRPLIDNHSIAILNVIKFILENNPSEEEEHFVNGYAIQVLESLSITYSVRKRLPELYNNIYSLCEFVAFSKRPSEYVDSSSFLILILFEILSILKDEENYLLYKEVFDEKVNLQAYYPDFDYEDIEQLLFEKEIRDEGYCETNIKLEEHFSAFVLRMKETEYIIPNYRTDKAGFKHLRYLAHAYFKTPFFIDEWYKFLNKF